MYTPLQNEFERSSKILGLFVSPISQMVAAKEENLQNSSEVRNLDFLDTHNNNSIFTHYLTAVYNDFRFDFQGYSMSHALRKWAALGFICHYFMLAVFLLNKLIRDGTFFSLPRWLHLRKSEEHDQSSSVSAR